MPAETDTLRVAIVGSGPAGFYAAEHLFKQDIPLSVDMFDRLPTPFGLVRGGVAPDHQKIKGVTKVYDRVATQPNFRFFGYVELGKDIQLDEMRHFYHAIILTTGAQTDKKLGIPGEDLERSHPATEFVAWYNGHPDFRHLTFDLSQERVAVIGVGNVAVDVARILSRTPDELRETDIADYALEALAESQIKEVYLLGRRGPAQAAFTNPEIKELGELAGADCIVLPEEAELDPLSAHYLKEAKDRQLTQKVEIIQSYADRQPNKPKKLFVRFLVSPTEIHDDGQGGVGAMTLVHNELFRNDIGAIHSRSTDKFEKLACGLVFRSIGYRGVPISGVPFRDDWGTVPNAGGRVLDGPTGPQVPGLYTAGWIKRGPSGVIGTNKPDAVETVTNLLEDHAEGMLPTPDHPDPAALEALVRKRQPNFFSYADWLRLDALELSRGEATGRPRLKFTTIDDMIAALKE
ncbi:MAG: FAD-dependent oxidoreductase [Anaerolineales bacterium]